MDYELFLNDRSANDTPEEVTVSRQVIEQLTKNLKKTSLEFALYFFSVYQGEKKEIAGRTFKAVPFDMDHLSKMTGYAKTRIYEAVNNLIEWNVFVPLEFQSRNGTKTYLLVSNKIPVQRKLSGTAESFRHSGNDKKGRKPNDDAGSGRFEKESVPYYTKYNTNNLDNSNKDVNDTNEQSDNVFDLFDNVTSNNNVTNTLRIEYVYNNITYTLKLDRKQKNELEYLDTRIQTALREIDEGKDSYNELDTLREARNTLLKRLVDKQRSGYRSKEYASLRGHSEPKNKKTAYRFFVSYYMCNVFNKRNVDFYIPKSNMSKYYARAKKVLEHFGSWAKTKEYIDWYLRQDNHSNLQFSLDALVSTALINSYENSDTRETRKGISKGFVESVDEAKQKANKGTII